MRKYTFSRWCGRGLGIALLSAATAAHAQFVTDGTREAAYDDPLAVQMTPTGFGDNSQGSQILANGSELNAAYARIVGTDLYLFLSGNLESNGNPLELFFDTKTGGQNTLLGTNPDVDGNGLNWMAGLTFDAGFGADYYLTLKMEASGTISVHYATLNEPTNVGALVATGNSTNLAITLPVGTAELGLDNSNTAGVTSSVNAGADDVRTGIELKLPLAALGAPVGDFRLCTFINGGGHGFLSNQVLAPLGQTRSNLGDPATVNFSQIGAAQSVLIARTAASRPLLGLSQTELAFIATGGVGGTGVGIDLIVSNPGKRPLVLSNPVYSNPMFSTVSGSLVGAIDSSASRTVRVRFLPTSAAPQTGTLTFTTNDPNQPTVVIPLSGTTIVSGGSIVTDGVRDTDYPAALALQTNATGFGDNQSELNAAYAHISGGTLHLLLTGNLENNGNPLELFFDTQTGGQNVLTANNPTADGNAPNSMSGLRFDAGFVPDYYLTLRLNGTNFTAGFAPLNGAGGAGTALATNLTAAPYTLDFGSMLTGSAAINNANTGGVTAVAVGTPGAVTTGIELAIPLSVLGAPTGDFRVMAVINGGGHGFLSNQSLAGMPLGTANLGNPTTVDFTTIGGDQFFTVPNAAPTAPGISVAPNPLAIGSVAVGGTGTGTLTVTNTGTADLLLSGITSDNARFTVAPTTATVAAGASATFTVTFAPTATGAQTATLSIASNAAGSPTTVTVTGTGTAAAAIAVDGTRDPNYGTALALQTTPTGFGDATGGGQTSAGGSELDGAYAHIDNGTLYLLLTGNLESNGNRLNLFFDTNSGTGQRLLAANNPDVDNNGLNRHAGLFFDGGFTADYFLTTNIQNPAALEATASFAPVNGAGGVGTLLTAAGAGLSKALTFSGSLTGQLAIDNSNTGGVGPLGASLGTPAAVATGLEYAIPLAALGNPTGPIRVAAFITSGDHGFMSNQVLAGLPDGTANLGNPSVVSFGAFAGNQFFTIANGTAAPVAVASASVLTFGNTTVGSPTTRRLVVRNVGNAPLTVTGITSDNAVFTAAPTTGSVAVGDSLVVTVTFAPTAAGLQSGTLTLASNDPGQPTLTVGLTGTGVAAPTAVLSTSVSALSLGSVTVGATGTATFRVRNRGNAPLSLTGITSSDPQFSAAPTTGTVAVGDSLLVTVTFAPTAAGAATATLTLASNGGTATVALTGTGLAAGAIVVDGSLDAGYLAPLTTQTNTTGFGNTTSGSQTVATGGSELDAAYARIDGGMLYLLLTGNLESNGNKLELFFDTQAGGQNTLLGTNPDVDGNGLNRMAGLTFDAGFAPDYFLTLNNTNPAAGFTTAAYFAPVNGAGGIGTTLANGLGRTQSLVFDGTTTGQMSLDNSNVAGVDGTALNNPAAVTTGVELAIPLSVLGNPTGPIRISAFINGASHDFVSNQVLAGLPLGTANLGDPAGVNFTTPAGNQFFVVPNGAAPVASVSTTTLNIGNVTVGSTGTGTFTVYNTGTAPLEVSDIASSVATFTTAPIAAIIAPGDSLLVTVTFAPTVAAPLTTVVTVVSNDPANPALTVIVNGTGVVAPAPLVAVSATNLVFNANVGLPVSRPFTVRNTGNAPLQLTGLLISNPAFTAAPTTGTIAPGDSLVVTVTFSAPAPPPVVTLATLIVQTNDAVTTPPVVNLRGEVLVGLPAELTAAVSLAPNPATKATTLRVPTALLTRGASLTVFDATGRVVLTRDVASASSAEVSLGLEVESLPRGTYVVRLLTPDGVLSRRLVLTAE